MAANTDPIFIVQPNVQVTEIDNADGTTAVKIWEPDETLANGGILRAINVTNDEGTNAQIDVDILISDTTAGTNKYYLGTVRCTAGLGRTANTDSVNALDPTSIAGLTDDGEILVPDNFSLWAQLQVAMSSGDVCHIVAIGGDY